MRRPALAELASPELDLLVVGGGIIGCGVARDAALRGLRVALVEQDDFASGTTSRSTRLIHGGLRYLELYDFALVREDLREREILLRLAPHLVKPLPFLVPMYRQSLYKRLRLRAGLALYDLLSYDKSLPNHRFLSRGAALSAEPNLNPAGLQGAARYFDAQVEFPERLALENILDAAAHGALARNYTRVERFVVEDRRVLGAEVVDTTTGERAVIRARLALVATGPWLDRTLHQIRPDAPPLLRTTKGVHLAAPKLGPNAVVLFAKSDRRLFFVVPWHGMSLIGTTDTDEPNPPETAHADRDDIGYLLAETRRAFPRLADLTPYYTMAGVRALARKEGVHESQVSRRHALRDHQAEGGPAGVVSVVGGKITGYRAIAEDAVDLVVRKLGRSAPCLTARRPLPGTPLDCARLEAELATAADGLPVDVDQRRYLLHQYGRRAPEVLRVAREGDALAERVVAGQPTLLAEVLFTAREEAAAHLTDVMLRRTPLGFAPDQSLEAAPRVAALLGRALGWDTTRARSEIEEYVRQVANLYSLERAETSAAS